MKAQKEALFAAESRVNEEEIIKKVSTSFYDWYLMRINSLTDTVPFDYIFVEGKNGKCKVNFEPYFTQLKKLGTISEKFMNREIKRAESCIKHMETVDWIEYDKSEAYEYEDYCPDCYYMYWVRSQEPYTGVDIVKTVKKENIWYSTLQFFNTYDGKTYRENNLTPVVKIENENGKWMITEITL